MDPYQNKKEEILALNGEIVSLINQGQASVREAQAAGDPWLQTCAHIEQQLKEHVLRIAVVGAIKSGKSTTVNALLGDDHLKRGAGVVTSIVTRVRRGDELKARLYFKSWDEVNADIESALVLFPSDEWRGEEQKFDIRRSKDRLSLHEALSSLDARLLVARDRLNPNSVILASYLKGYDQVEALVGPENTTQTFKGEHFSNHRAYVGDDALAAYLRDIQLEITGDALDANIEVADCQGSDSPNPLHMAMIQDYLLKAHLIVYVISSRTGLRQADIRFLNIIKKMGIADNILFVCNFDINEHEQLSDLESLVQRVREELTLVLPEPQLFVFSSLFHLFAGRKKKLSGKDKSQLSQWRKSSKLVALSEEELKRLKLTLEHKLTRERSALLLQNQLERMDVVVKGLQHWGAVNRDWLQRDAAEVRQMTESIENHQGHLQKVLSMVHTALGGSVQTLKQNLRKEIDGFFDKHSSDVLDSALNFVRNYRIDLNDFRDQLTDSGFNHALYMLFQEFKQAVDGFMAEKINPEIIAFMGQKEDEITAYLISVAEPYSAMVLDAVQQYEGALEQYDFAKITGQLVFDAAPNLDTIKQSKGLVLPPAAATMHYSAQIKTDAVMRLGFFSLVRFFRKVLKKPISDKDEEAFQALKGAIRRMKRETERSLVAHFKDYKENIKFQYILPLADAAGSRLFESMTERFQGYMANLSDLTKTMGDERSDKEAIKAGLIELEQALEETIRPRIDALRHDVQLMRGDGIDPPGQAASKN